MHSRDVLAKNVKYIGLVGNMLHCKTGNIFMAEESQNEQHIINGRCSLEEVCTFRVLQLLSMTDEMTFVSVSSGLFFPQRSVHDLHLQTLNS